MDDFPPNASNSGSHIGYGVQSTIEETKSPLTLNQYEPEALPGDLEPKFPDIHRHRKTLRWWIVFCLTFLILSPLLSVVLGLHFHSHDFSYTPNPSNLVFNGRTLLMEAVLVSADPMQSMMTFDWTILSEENSQCTPTALDQCSDVNIFFDNNLLVDTDPSAMRTSDPPSVPLFRHNATGAILNDITANTPTFRTELQLFSPGNHESSLIYYPFDIYTAEIFVFAQDAKTNNSVGIKLSSTRGIAVGFKTNAIDYPGVFIPAGMLDIFVTLQRGNLIRAFCVIATIAVWLITLVLLLLMFTCVVFGFRQRSEVLIVPVATVFAFTQLRGSMHQQKSHRLEQCGVSGWSGESGELLRIDLASLLRHGRSHDYMLKSENSNVWTVDFVASPLLSTPSPSPLAG